MKKIMLSALLVLSAAVFSSPASAEPNFSKHKSVPVDDVSTPKASDADEAQTTGSAGSQEPAVSEESAAPETVQAVQTESPDVDTEEPPASKFFASSTVSKSKEVASAAASAPITLTAQTIVGTVFAMNTQGASPWFEVKLEKGGDVTIQIEKTSGLSKGGKQATWADLKVGDHVTAAASPRDFQMIAGKVDVN